MLVEITDLKKIQSVAEDLGITYQTLRMRIKKGLYKVVIIDGIQFIDCSYEKTEHQKMIDSWYSFYHNKHKINPRFVGHDARCIKELREYFEQNVKNVSASECFSFILQNWDGLDKFVKDSYSLSILLKQINSVIAKLKNVSSKNQTLNRLSNEFKDI
jgi:hypothetical protein